MELLDIYTINKTKTGKTIPRHADRNELQEGEYFLFEQAWIVNSKKEILLTQRAFNKKYGGMWDLTSGHVSSGENSIQGIKREIFEEIGLDLKDDDLVLAKSFVENKSIKEIWVINKDVQINDLKFRDNEVIGAKFVSIDELLQMIERNESFNNLRYFQEIYQKL